MKTSSASRCERDRCQPPRGAARRDRRRGFTLVELLVVLVIISILISLILPALSGVWVNARVVQVKADISAIDAAIGKFKSDFNIDPPSSIAICERATDWTDTSIGPPTQPSVQERARSRALIRQLWPQYDFTVNRDINLDGDNTDIFFLHGAECLVFFLGGVGGLSVDIDNDGQFDAGDTMVPRGFSANPANPFGQGGNRKGPYFDFVPSRILQSTDPRNNGFLAYLDPYPGQTSPYIYASSYGGKGYIAADLGLTVAGADVYRQSAPTAAIPVPPAWNPTKYQIISPGADHEYGVGGVYIADQWESLLIDNGTTNRRPEQDNITNFHSRTLSTK